MDVEQGLHHGCPLPPVRRWAQAVVLAWQADPAVVEFRCPLPTLQGESLMATIADQLETYRSSLAEALSRGDQAVAHRIETQIEELEAYRQRHPEAAMAPSAFEVFCELNPADEKCRVYDD
jgi:hypothetical protein